SGAAYRDDDRVLIPVDYINANIGGLSAEYDEAKRILSVTRDKLSASTPKRPVYDEICLFVQPAAPLAPIFASDDIPGLDNLLFKAELTDYEDAMDPLDTRDAYLELVNSSHPLSSDTRPTDLVDLAAHDCLYSVKQLRAVPARALTALFLEAAANGIENLKVRYGFLGYYDQSYFHEFYQTRKADIATLAAAPGEAEYQTGLCVEMDDLSGKGDYELSDFAASETFFWLRDNAWKFGFILRYPEGKEEITGYPFEPWHFRYVGRYHAYQIYTKGMCLEEYVAYLSEQ
ncbi:MAG: M15 family metallopeptidase, partial [Clostridia bacterium]|nr:M15 family metallopeptidase [Clostridia bacterium]